VDLHELFLCICQYNFVFYIKNKRCIIFKIHFVKGAIELEKNLSNTITQITIGDIGIALFVVLSLCLQVPVFDNYYLCLGYIVMAVYCYSIGTISGTIISTLGIVLYCFLINGLRGMPGWAIGNIVVGLIAGSAFKWSKNLKNKWIKRLICLVATIIGTAIGILCIKSGVESILYAQPVIVRMTKNISAFLADIVVLMVSLPLCEVLDPHIQKILKRQ
jgi:uncharacterized membrane protein